jgi:hypothetical protein
VHEFKAFIVEEAAKPAKKKRAPKKLRAES